MLNIRSFLAALRIVPTTATAIDTTGELEVLPTGKLNYFGATTASPVVTEAHAATLTNKSIDADTNTITNIENADIKAAAAIDATKMADGTVSSTEFQYINSLSSNAQTQLNNGVTATALVQTNLDTHVSDATDAHAGSAITNTPSGNLAATTVQGALNELQTDVDTRATATALTDHINDATDAHAGTAITNTPAGNIAATTVQAAINELDTEKQPLDSTLTSLAAYNTNGILTQTAADTFVGRTLTGTANQITVTNGSGVGGNPTLSIPSDPVIPGTDSVTLPQGTTVQRGASVAGKLRYNSDTASFEGYTTAWGAIAGAGSAINYIASTDGASIGAWAAYSDASTATVTIASPAVFTIASTTGYYIGMPISLTTTGALPTGLTASTTYYISTVVGATTYKVAATVGGVDINTSGTQSGVHTGRPGVPITGTGGSLSSTFAISTDSTLVGTTNFLWTKTATNLMSEGFSYAFAIDSALKSKPLTLSAYYSVSSGTYASAVGPPPTSDMTVWVLDVTNNALIQPSAYTIQNVSGSATIKCEFQAASNSTSYRLCVHTASPSASAYTLRFDQWSISPNTYSSGASITDPVAWTPTGSWTGGTVAYTGLEMRVGGWNYYQVKVATSGAPTSASLTINLNRTIDTTRLAETTSAISTLPHSGGRVNDSSTNAYVLNVAYESTTSVRVAYVNTAASQVTSVTQAAPITFGAGDSVVVWFAVPIAGWGTSQVLSSDTDTRVVGFSATGSGGAVTANVTNLTSNTTTYKDTHGGWNGTTYTVPVAGDYKALGAAATGAAGTIYAYVNGSSYRVIGVGGLNSTLSGILENLKAGDLVTFRSDATGTYTYFRIALYRESGPAQIAASELIAGRYYAATATITGSFSTVTYSTKDFDTHGVYTSGTLTIPAAGKYQFNAGLFGAFTGAINNAQELAIFKNGTQINSGLQVAGGSQTNIASSVSDVVSCLAGDLITVKVLNNGTGPTVAASNFRNYFSWARVGN